MSQAFYDTSENFHPFECDSDKCRHCRRIKDESHDPSACALCDPDYDMQPNELWIGDNTP